MHAPSKILVPVDFSQSSREALEYAAELGARLGAEVDVLHVWRPPNVVGSKEGIVAEFTQSDAGHLMMEWLVEFDLRGDVATHGRLAATVRSDVSETIVEVAETGAYDLVVMATHGRHGLSLLFRGSVAAKVASRAPCPVVTLRAVDDEAIVPAVEETPEDLRTTGVWNRFS